MNIFILCTGRCGSMSISRACQDLENFSSGHETRISKLGVERLNFPSNHIEADNRLSWFLGRLDAKYGNDAFYVHMTRDPIETAKSYNLRWYHVGSIVRSYTEGILTKPLQLVSSNDLLKYSEDYCTTVNENIVHFLKDKDKKCVIRLENLESDFLKFWDLIEAKGNKSKALEALNQKHNKSRTSNSDFRFRLKLFFMGLRNNFLTR